MPWMPLRRRKDVCKTVTVGTDSFAALPVPSFPLDEAAEAQRAARVGEQLGKITPV